MKLSLENAVGCAGAASLAVALCGGMGAATLKGAAAIYEAGRDSAVSHPVETRSAQPAAPVLAERVEADPRADFIGRLHAAFNASIDVQLLTPEAELERLVERLQVAQPGITPLDKGECSRRATILNDKKLTDNIHVVSGRKDLTPRIPLNDIAGCVELDANRGTAFIHTDREAPTSTGDSRWRVTNFGPALDPHNSKSLEVFTVDDASCRYWLPDYDVVGKDDYRRRRSIEESMPCDQAYRQHLRMLGLDNDPQVKLVAGVLDKCLYEGYQTGRIQDPNVFCTQLGIEVSRR